MTHPAVAHDNLDDRREAVRLLNRLPPRERVRFLKWACNRAAVPNSKVRPAPAPAVYGLAEEARWDDGASAKLTQDVYGDLFILAHQYDLDLDLALLRLEQLVRHGAR